MTNSDYTDITVILDRSGSMEAIKTDAEGGLNTFIDEQRNLGGECRLTLVQFDDEYEVVYQARDIATVPRAKLQPRATTALLDAIGKTVTTTGERLAAMSEDDRPGHVIVVILTDGLENASREWTRERVFELVKQQSEQYGWIFTYLGANQDAIAVGASLGVPAAATMDYLGDNVGVAFAAASAATSRTRGGGSFNYTTDERDAAGTSSQP